MGTYVVQLARWKGAEVIATASARHADFLRELGAATVIDYATTRFETVARDVDLVIDTLGGETRARSWQVIRPGGMLVGLTSPFDEKSPRADVRAVFFIVHPHGKQLAEIGRLVDARAIQPFVQEVFPLADVRKAFERAAAGHLRGKLILRVVN